MLLDTSQVIHNNQEELAATETVTIAGTLMGSCEVVSFGSTSSKLGANTPTKAR